MESQEMTPLAAGMKKVLDAIGELPQLSSEEYEIERAKSLNERRGELEGEHCPRCLDKGYIAEVKDGVVKTSECVCMARRRSLARIRKSGLGDMLARYTFDAWQTPEEWQKKAYSKAQDYLQNGTGKWFVATGCVGSGKSHLCTAICGKLLNAGLEVRYMMWRDIGSRIKAAINDTEEYRRLLQPLKTTKVLYIDDFLKAGKSGVTQGDINLAFELLNYRYNDRKLITVISSELTIEQIMDIDEAVGSRIYERSRDYYLKFTGNKNWRLKNHDRP